MSQSSSTCQDIRQLRQQQLDARQREQQATLAPAQRHTLNNHLAKLETALWLLENNTQTLPDMDYGAAAAHALGEIDALLKSAGV